MYAGGITSSFTLIRKCGAQLISLHLVIMLALQYELTTDYRTHI